MDALRTLTTSVTGEQEQLPCVYTHLNSDALI